MPSSRPWSGWMQALTAYAPPADNPFNLPAWKSCPPPHTASTANAFKIYDHLIQKPHPTTHNPIRKNCWVRTPRLPRAGFDIVPEWVYLPHNFSDRFLVERISSWAEKNTWFGRDSAMTYTAFDLHKKLTEEEGFDPQSDEYYSEIDKRIRLEFPHKFGTTNAQVENTAKPTQIVASAKRSVNNSSRKTVRLTPSQVAIAKKLGVPLEEYAKQLKITKEV